MSISYTPPQGITAGNANVGGTLTVTGPVSAGSIVTAGTTNTGVLLASGSVRGSPLTTAGTLIGAYLTLGGTTGRWAFGTVGLTSGVGTIATGLTTVQGAFANAIGGNSIGAGSLTSVQLDLTLGGAGSVIMRGLTAALPFSSNSTVTWGAFGV